MENDDLITSKFAAGLRRDSEVTQWSMIFGKTVKLILSGLARHRWPGRAQLGQLGLGHWPRSWPSWISFSRPSRPSRPARPARQKYSHTKHTPKKSSNPQILKRRRYVAAPKILEMKPQNLRFHFQDSRNPQILGVELGWNYFERRHFEDFFSVCFACEWESEREKQRESEKKEEERERERNRERERRMKWE